MLTHHTNDYFSIFYFLFIHLHLLNTDLHITVNTLLYIDIASCVLSRIFMIFILFLKFNVLLMSGVTCCFSDTVSIKFYLILIWGPRTFKGSHDVFLLLLWPRSPSTLKSESSFFLTSSKQLLQTFQWSSSFAATLSHVV